VLGVFAILAGVFGTAGGVVLSFTNNAILQALGITSAVIGVLYFAAGVGFFQASGWAWIVGLVASVLGLARNAVEVALGSLLYGIPGLAIAIVIIVYLTRPRVRAFFGKANAQPRSSP
jgi:uncharacterized membrane protein (DUF2068 family)